LAVCFHGRQLGIPVVVVMPRHAPIMKVNNCKSFGAVVINKGIDLGEVNNLINKGI
jgi:threonine dehydratase